MKDRIKKEKYTTYAPDTDINFIMIDTYENGEIISTECVGWYHGDENEEDTEYFTGKLKGVYNWGDTKQ